MVGRQEITSYSAPDYEFGNRPQYRFIQAHAGVGGLVTGRAVLLERPGLEEGFSQAEYEKKLEEIRGSLQSVTDPKTRKTFEIAAVNQDAADKNGAVLHISTSGSSIKDNPSNAAELAQSALQHPDRTIFYVAAPGNGGSSGLNENELREAKRTGSFTYVDAEKGALAIPTLEALGRALDSLGGNITHMTANASGAHYATALMVAMPEGQIERAFFKSRTNISDLLPVDYMRRMVLSNMKPNREYARVSQDPLWITKERREQAAEILGKGFGSKVTQAQSGTFGLRKMWGEAVIFSKVNRGYANRPAAGDTLAALSRQPDAKLTYYFPLFDPQYTREVDIDNFNGDVVSALGEGALEGNTVVVLKGPGTHYDHTYYPSMRAALEDYAFTRP